MPNERTRHVSTFIQYCHRLPKAGHRQITLRRNLELVDVMPEAKESDITFVSPADLHERGPCFCGNDKGRSVIELLCQYNLKTFSRITFTGIGDAAVIIVLKWVWR